MKKAITVIAMLAAACCLGLVSCQEWFGIDQPSSVNPEITADQEFWGVVGQLVGKDQRTDDYEGKTFKPAIGEPDGGDESVRVVAVNSLDGAIERFNNLVNGSVTPEMSTYEYKSKEVGTLTWTKSTDNRSWGIVDVNVAAVPSLQKIIYRSAEQGDVNGSVGDEGSAYYRFGDVIQRTRQDDGKTEYWICVRPAFDKEDKGKSHWVSVSPLPKENVWPYYDTGKPFTASNGFDYGLPYNLGTDLEWHQDLAELLFAIMYPTDWFQNIGNYSSVNILGNPSGLPIFNDFHCTNIRYHNINYWKNVQKQWKDKNLIKKIFGVSYDDMAAAIKPDGTGRGLHFLYDEYSWSTRFSNKPKLYQVHYTHGTKDTEKNMHKRTKSAPCAQVVEPKKKTESNINYPLDVYDVVQYQPYISESRFFGDAAPRWCVRYAEGIELSENGKFDPQQPIKGFIPEDEVYRYYKDVYPTKNLTQEAEETQDTVNGWSGRAHYRWGNVYQDEKGAKWYVFNQAGYDSELNDPVLDEHSPYSELISFDPKGFEISSGGGKVTNLPPLDVVLRVVPFLYQANAESSKIPDNMLAERPAWGQTTLNIRDAAGVDIRYVMQLIKAQDPKYRNLSITSIAYDSPGANQALLRVVVNIQNEKQDPNMYCWTKYPSAPDLTTQFVTNFSNSTIYLQDIADQDMVNKYAPDTYAVQPLSTFTLPSSDGETKRSIRTTADARALKVSNYFYDLDTFRNVQYPGSMWNEPVLVFRYTRVRDHGDTDYDTKTVDGHTLTLVKERPWTVPGFTNDRDKAYDYFKNFPAELWTTAKDCIYLNGQHYTVVKWQDLNF